MLQTIGRFMTTRNKKWISVTEKKPHDSRVVIACFESGGRSRIKMLRYIRELDQWTTDDVIPIEFRHDILYWCYAPMAPQLDL